MKLLFLRGYGFSIKVKDSKILYLYKKIGKFWVGEIKSIDSKEMNESIPISLNCECQAGPSYLHGSIQFKGCKILFIVGYHK